MFSATVSDGNKRASWNDRPRPAHARRSADHAVTSVEPRTMRPASGMRKPETMSRIVVLPAPFGPMRPTISPSRTVRVASSTARMPPKRFTTPSSRRATSAGGESTAGSAFLRRTRRAGLSSTAAPAPCRNTARRMSSRSSRSAVAPENRTSPFSMNTARSASRRATFTDCSTRITVVPWAWMARTISTSRSTIVGAKPSESSSIISSRGLAMNAIASPSICCSPPDRSPAAVSARSTRIGKYSRTFAVAALT